MPPLTSKSRGIIYVAWGEQYVNEAKSSAESLKRYSDLPITLITSSAIEHSHPFDHILISSFSSTYRDKIMMRDSPYNETIFVDTDTIFLGDISEIFDLLERFDLIYQPSAPSDHYTLHGVPMHAFDEPSAGLIAWRKNERTERFFETWDAEYTVQEQANGNGAWDQRSMRAAIWNTDVTIAPLSKDWQLYSFEFSIAMNKVKMIHGRGRDAKTAIDNINKYIGPRLYAPRLGVTRAWIVTPLDYIRLSFAAFRMFLHRSARLILHKTGIWRLPENKRPA